MCSYNITLNDTLVEKVRPSFPDDQALTLWLQEQIEELLLNYCAQHTNAEELKPYTIEELHERIAKSERDFVEGNYFTDDEVFADLDEYEKKEKLQYAEAV